MLKLDMVLLPLYYKTLQIWAIFKKSLNNFRGKGQKWIVYKKRRCIVEMDFLSSGIDFLLFNLSFCKWKLSLKLVQTQFQGNTSFPLLERDFLSSGNFFLLLRAFLSFITGTGCKVCTFYKWLFLIPK